MYASTVHRVINSADAGLHHRYSIPFFFNPNLDARVECLPPCRLRGRALFQPSTCEGVLMARYAETFAHMRQRQQAGGEAPSKE